MDRLRIASGGHDGTVRVWDLENGSLMHSFKPFVGAAAAAADRSDDNNNSDINAHRQQEDDVDDNVLRGNNNNNNNTTTSPLNVAVNCCQLTDMKLVAGGDDSLVHVWDFSPYQK